MTDDELVRRYEALRRAATAVVEATAADRAPVFPAHRQKLDALERALNDLGPQNAATREVLDPNVHALSMRDYKRGVPGGVPLSLTDRAQSIRRSLAADDVAERPVAHWPDDRVPVLTELEAMIIATLLQELAARLAATRDPGGTDLAAITQMLADEILAPTFAGAQR